jgi:hypothetical protein
MITLGAKKCPEARAVPGIQEGVVRHAGVSKYPSFADA